MLTNKGKYGIKALLHLAALPVGTFAQTASIASENNISKKFLDAIMFELKNAGFLFSKKGPGGGFSLARPPEEIRIGYVIRVLDGPLAPIACASHTAYVPCRDCRDVETCRVRLLMLKVRNAMADILDNLTLAALCGGGGAGPGPAALELLEPVAGVPGATAPKKTRQATVTA